MIKVHDNLLSLRLLYNIEQSLIFDSSWYFCVDTEYKNRVVAKNFNFGYVKERKNFGEVDNSLLTVLKSIGYDTSKIGRSFTNCFRKGDATDYHQDPGKTTYLFYVNQRWKKHWGAPTKFKLRKYRPSIKVYPRPGRLIVYDSSIRHKGNAPTFFMPRNIPGRFSIVFHENQ